MKIVKREKSVAATRSESDVGKATTTHDVSYDSSPPDLRIPNKIEQTVEMFANYFQEGSERWDSLVVEVERVAGHRGRADLITIAL